MDNFNPDVELAIELGAREIAKCISDRYSADFTKVHKNMNSMIRAAARYSCSGVVGWVKDSGDDQWLRLADEVAQLDGASLDRALGRWWDSLDDKGKLDVIMSTHKKTEFLGNLKQKYQSNPDKMGQDLPALSKIYQEESNPSRVPVPTTAPAPAAPAEEAPSA